MEDYSLTVSSGLMLVKAAGVPVPIPADLILLAVAASAAQGKAVLWQAFLALLLAVVLGALIQFWLARGPARRFIYRFGRYVGLTTPRLEATAGRLRQRGPLGICLAIMTPGVRSVTVAACGLAGMPLATFLPGLLLGSSLDLALHFFLGYAGGTLLADLALPLVVGMAVVGLAGWLVIRQRKAAGKLKERSELVAETYESWQEAACPVCLALGALLTPNLRPARKQ